MQCATFLHTPVPDRCRCCWRARRRAGWWHGWLTRGTRCPWAGPLRSTRSERSRWEEAFRAKSLSRVKSGLYERMSGHQPGVTFERHCDRMRPLSGGDVRERYLWGGGRFPPAIVRRAGARGGGGAAGGGLAARRRRRRRRRCGGAATSAAVTAAARRVFPGGEMCGGKACSRLDQLFRIGPSLLQQARQACASSIALRTRVRVAWVQGSGLRLLEWQSYLDKGPPPSACM
jgi:hypothetical protein